MNQCQTLLVLCPGHGDFTGAERQQELQRVIDCFGVTAQVARNQHDWMFLTGFTRLTGLMEEEGRMNLTSGQRVSSNRTIGRTAYGGESC